MGHEKQHVEKPAKPRTTSRQISLRTILFAIAFMSAVLAILITSNEFVKFVAVCVVAANFLGLIAGVFVTFVLRMPRDGGYRHADEGKKN